MDPNRDKGDVGLMRLARDGDDDALRQLYARHRQKCLTRAQMVLRDAALAEDAVQEAFLDFWRNADRYDAGRGDVAVWLLMLVHRRAVDLARREARRRLVNPLLPPLPQGSYGAEEEVLLLLERRRVRVAIDELTSQQRELVELAYYGGFTQRELSKHLGVPLGTIKSRMSTALARLAVAVA